MKSTVTVCCFVASLACGDAVEETIDFSQDIVPQCTEHTFFADDDGDTYGDAAESTKACEKPAGFVEISGDCDDSDAAINPDGREVCDGDDNDCDGLFDSEDPSVDLATTTTYYRDDDGDGYGSSVTIDGCDMPAGYVDNDDDCRDDDSSIHPGATEICDDQDNDCDTLTDDDDVDVDLMTGSAFYVDDDGDGIGAGDEHVACRRPAGYVEEDGDCDDDNERMSPALTEVCDNLDNDCDGGIDGTASDPNQCDGYPGSYIGSYAITAAEKLGSTVINQMNCVGTSDVVVNLGHSPALTGTMVCAYASGGGLFDSNQSSTIEADVALDGTFVGSITHVFNDGYYDGITKTYSFAGAIEGDALAAAGTGWLRPHPRAAVDWEVDFTFDGDRAAD